MMLYLAEVVCWGGKEGGNGQVSWYYIIRFHYVGERKGGKKERERKLTFLIRVCAFA